MKLDHIGIAVRELDSALGLWRDALGASCSAIEEVASQKVRVAFLETGEGKTELLEPTAGDSPIAKHLDAGRPALHHVAYRVEDLDGTLSRLKESGVPLINQEGVPGAHGTRIAFVHPKGTGGVLLELVEYPER